MAEFRGCGQRLTERGREEKGIEGRELQFGMVEGNSIICYSVSVYLIVCLWLNVYAISVKNITRHLRIILSS